MKKKSFSLIALTFCFAFITISFFSPPIVDGSQIENRYSYKGILTLYSLDTFEGGINSRADFLRRAAIAFEKTNPGVFVQVSSLTPYELQDRLSRGLAPDIFVYSFGYYRVLKENYAPYTLGINYADSLYQNDFSVPLWYGGYFGFTVNTEYPYVCGESEFTNPYLACIFSDKEIIPNTGFTQKSAYESFVFKKFNLIGTQRDVFRTRNSDRNIEKTVWSDFTDLVQYGSVVGISDERAYFAQKFLEYMTSSVIQKKLYEIGMFSVSGEKLYDGIMGEFEERISNLSVPELDRSAEEITQEKERAILAMTDTEIKKDFFALYGKSL